MRTESLCLHRGAELHTVTSQGQGEAGLQLRAGGQALFLTPVLGLYQPSVPSVSSLPGWPKGLHEALPVPSLAALDSWEALCCHRVLVARRFYPSYTVWERKQKNQGEKEGRREGRERGRVGREEGGKKLRPPKPALTLWACSPDSRDELLWGWVACKRLFPQLSVAQWRHHHLAPCLVDTAFPV